jgi:NitT/TauT family transport system permease protein
MPIIILFLGLDDTSKVFLIVFVLFFQVVVTTRDAVKKVPSETLDSFYALGGKRYQTYFHVLWPAALADVLTMLRQSVGMAMAVLFLAETYATDRGLGFLIVDFKSRVEYDKMYAAILVMAVLGVAFFMVIDLLEWRFCRWRRQGHY